MSQETLLTKELFLEVMQGVNGRFESIDDQFRKVHEKLREHDDLLEMIAGEVSGTQNLLNELAPARKDHETRISRLERGFTKLILKS